MVNEISSCEINCEIKKLNNFKEINLGVDKCCKFSFSVSNWKLDLSVGSSIINLIDFI